MLSPLVAAATAAVTVGYTDGTCRCVAYTVWKQTPMAISNPMIEYLFFMIISHILKMMAGLLTGEGANRTGRIQLNRSSGCYHGFIGGHGFDDRKYRTAVRMRKRIRPAINAAVGNGCA